MVKSNAQSVEEYLNNLSKDRKEIISTVRSVIMKNLPKGYEETIQSGMIAYVVPLTTLPDTYNHLPLQLAALASQKNFCSLYLMTVYGNPEINEWFLREYKKSGKKLDMGKSCLHFKTIEDLPLDLIGKLIAKVSLEDYVAAYKKIKKL